MFLMSFFKELHRRIPSFFYTGCFFLLLFSGFLVSLYYCQDSPTDLCHLLKPSKFALSFALYLFTLGWFLEYLKKQLGKKTIAWISGLITFLILMEMLVIFLQAGLSTVGHEDLSLSTETTAWISRGLYLTANMFIILESFVAIFVAIQFFRPINLQPTLYLWGIRAGFFIFIVSGLLGGYMVHRWGHVPDDPSQYGFPLTHFDNTRDYLLSLHFIGIHYLQIIPLLCFYFDKFLGKRFIYTVTGGYLIACLLALLFTPDSSSNLADHPAQEKASNRSANG